MSITNAFMSLDPQKQKRIINAALKEFAENGYKKASTNKIVEEAGIGKGMLFYYFESKQNLYNYLINYSINLIERNYYNLIEVNECDVLKRLEKTTRVKMQFIKRYPYIMDFFTTIYLEKFDKLNEKFKCRMDELQRKITLDVYGNIDVSLFREDIDPQSALKIIRRSVSGYDEEIQSLLRNKNLKSINFKPIWEELDEHLTTLKNAFYKKEEGNEK